MILKLDYNRIIERKKHTTMPDLMQTLFDYIIEHTLDTYCLQTKLASYAVYRDAASCKLQGQLTEEQQDLFEEFQKYNHKAQMEELFAMFLAAFDQSAALSRRHIA